MISIFHKEATGAEFHSSSYKATFCFMVNTTITNKDFSELVFKKKTVFLDSYIKEDISQSNYYRRIRLVTCSTCKTCLVTHSTHLTTRSTRSTRLSTHNTSMTTRSTHSTRLSTRSTRLSICLSIRNTRQSTRSTRTTICRSFYN